MMGSCIGMGIGPVSDYANLCQPECGSVPVSEVVGMLSGKAGLSDRTRRWYHTD